MLFNPNVKVDINRLLSLSTESPLPIDISLIRAAAYEYNLNGDDQEQLSTLRTFTVLNFTIELENILTRRRALSKFQLCLSSIKSHNAYVEEWSKKHWLIRMFIGKPSIGLWTYNNYKCAQELNNRFQFTDPQNLYCAGIDSF